MNIVLRSLLFLSLFLPATSCMKPPSQVEDHGPVAAASDVQTAIINAWGNADPSTIRKNEFTSLEQDQKISTLDPRVVYKESIDVLDRTVTPFGQDDITYSLLLRSTTMDESGSFKPVTSTNQEIVVKKPIQRSSLLSRARRQPAFPASMEALQKSMAKGSVGLYESEDDVKVKEQSLGLQTILNMFDACVRSDTWDVTCHNLKINQGWTLPPVGVSTKPNCGGIPNCQISYQRISFDLVVNLPNGDGNGTHQEKVVYDFTVSPDVPYLSRLTEFCYQGLVQASGQRILVKICNRVQNFLEGTENPPLPTPTPTPSPAP